MMLRSLCAVLAASCSLAAVGETFVLPASHDNTLFGPIADDLSSGVGQHIYIGRTSGNSGGNDLRRGLIRFDLSEVPVGSTVVSATLRMQIVWRPQNAAYPVATRLHRCTADWGEGSSNSPGGAGVPAIPGDATWTDRFHPDVQWTTPGGDFLDESSSEVSVVAPGPYFFEGEGIVEDVQSWIDGAPNHGWILIGDESTPSSAAKWVSRQNVAPTIRPRLILEIEPPETIRFLRPVQDSTLHGPITGDLASGSGVSLFSGRTSGNSGANDIRRALLKFDVSEIPSDASITSVKLRLEAFRRPPGAPATVTHDLHRCLADWGEGASNSPGGGGVPATPGDSTWTDRFYPDVEWTTPGGDFDPISSGSVEVSELGLYTFEGEGLGSDLQAWVDGAPNHGWILIGDESASRTVTSWLSREVEAIDPSRSPLLTVEFEIPNANAFDLTGDGLVDAADLAQLLSEWGASCPCDADLNDDLMVDAGDLALLLANWDLGKP